MRGFLLVICLFFPILALAQGYSSAPMLVGDTAKTVAHSDAPPPGFPETAVTRIGSVTSGQVLNQPADAPQAPDAPASPQPIEAKTPAAPVTPLSPVSKLWPRDTVPIFLRSCTGYHPELVAPCSCVITRLMSEMPHDEFLRLSENNTIEQDTRLLAIRQQCVGTPQRKE